MWLKKNTAFNVLHQTDSFKLKVVQYNFAIDEGVSMNNIIGIILLFEKAENISIFFSQHTPI